jgi:hypothetical protein
LANPEKGMELSNIPVFLMKVLRFISIVPPRIKKASSAHLWQKEALTGGI